MSEQPKTATDRLANVIQVIQLGKKTGKLIVERDNGPIFEQGMITFVKGQVTQASTGQRQGPDALNWLSTWGPCRFTFLPAAGSPGITAPLPAVSANGSTRSMSPNGAFDTNPGLRAQPQSPLPIRSAPPPGQQRVRSGPAEHGFDKQLHTSSAWITTPYRTRQLEEGLRLIERIGLSRAHRRLFLLVDGQRSGVELARLMAHEPEEVYKLLRDLQNAGVIQP